MNTRGWKMYSDSKLYDLLAPSVCWSAAALPLSREMCAPTPVSAMVLRLELIGFATQFCGNARRQFIARRKKQLGSKTLHNVRASSPASADRRELMLCVATIGIRRAREGERAPSPVGSVSDGSERGILLGKEENARHDPRGLAIHAIQGRPLESEFQHDAKTTRERGVQCHREVQAKDAAFLHKILERRQRLRFTGLRRIGVGRSRRTERAIHSRVFVEERQKDHDAFDNRRFDLVIQLRPRTVEPAMDRFEPVLPHRSIDCLCEQ